jgi:hypothetical protein
LNDEQFCSSWQIKQSKICIAFTLALTLLPPLSICTHLLHDFLLTLPTFDSPRGSPFENEPRAGAFVALRLPLLILSTL